MFRTIWSKTLRDYLVAILCWGIGAGLVMMAVFASSTPVLRDTYATIAQSFRFFGDAFAVRTPEGYVTTRLTELILPFLLCIWPMRTGARLVCGEEELGSLDIVLTTPQSRRRVILEKVLALVIASLVIALFIALGTIAGESHANVHVDFLRALLTAMNMNLLGFFFAMVALLFSQWTASQGAATGWASSLMILAFLLDGTGRTIHDTWIQYFSPFYYYNLNRPLIPGFKNTPAGALLLLGLGLFFAAMSLFLFVKRDSGLPVYMRQRTRVISNPSKQQSLRKAEHAISERAIILRVLSAQSRYAFYWLLGIVIYTAWCVLLIPSIQKPMIKAFQQSPGMAQSISVSVLGTIPGFLSVIVFFFLPVLFVSFAMMLALAWAKDLDTGRMELVLVTPQSRPRILLEHFGAIFLLILPGPVLTWLTITASAHMAHLNIDQGHLIAASFSMMPPALLIISLIYVLAGRLRSGAVIGILTTYIFLAFLVEFLQAVLQLPDWVMSLSIFYQYGSPISHGMNWGAFLEMTSVAIVLLIIATVQFRAVDIEHN